MALEDHHRVAFVGDDARSPSLNVGGEDGLTAALFRPGLDRFRRDSSSSGRSTPKAVERIFWFAIPVLDSGRAIGFIVKEDASQPILR
jgi:hypothetical protein